MNAWALLSEGPFADIINRFFVALDEADYDTILALFAPKGRWHRQGAVLTGGGVIREALEARPVQRIRHVISNTVADRRDDWASSVSYLTIYRRLGTKPGDAPPKIAGPFRVSLVRTEFIRASDDRWRIAEMRMEAQFDMNELAD